jgi:myo-inositol-hexaphosphate 3-phosphohydrolase
MLPRDAHSGHLETEFVREFPDLPRVEGIAITQEGRAFYVTDEDEGVHLRLTRMLAGQSS